MANVTEEEILRANFLKVIGLCNQLDIEYSGDESLDQIRQKLICRIRRESHPDLAIGDITFEERRRGQVAVDYPPNDLQILLDRITENFEKGKDIMLDIYDKVKLILEREDFDQIMRAEIDKRYDNSCLEQIRDNAKDLKFGDLPIVVTGETSAGKSSILNLLIGADILPTSVFKCTSAICRLRNSTESKITVTGYDGKKQTFKSMTDEEFKNKIKQYACTFTRKGVQQDGVKYVDIFKPIPMLRGTFTIVDTPHVSDDTDLTSRLFEYLPKALALIYVLNTPVGGGTQTDRIGKIFTEQKKEKKKGELHYFDTRTTLFICNKWDAIPKHEEVDVWKAIIANLRCHWPGLRENQVFKFSVIKEKKKKEMDLSTASLDLSGISENQCEDCDYTTADKSNFNRHRQTHGEKKIVTSTPSKSVMLQCDQCGRRYKSKRGLRLHVLNKHDKTYKYKCQLCEKGFNQTLTYRSHCAKHTGFGEKCVRCKGKFTITYALRRHMGICKKNDNDTQESSKYKCNICNFQFARKSGLGYHMKGKHQPPRYLCQLCGNRYAWRSSLRAHVKHAHKDSGIEQ